MAKASDMSDYTADGTGADIDNVEMSMNPFYEMAVVKTPKVVEPPKRGAGVKVPEAATLVQKLKIEAKAI